MDFEYLHKRESTDFLLHFSYRQSPERQEETRQYFREKSEKKKLEKEKKKQSQ